MKFKNLILTFVIINWFLNGCKSNPIQAPTYQPLKFTAIISTPTSPQQNSTITVVPTLYPEDAIKIIRERFGSNSDCSAPCFWGITPKKTTLDEAQSIFTHLGFQITEDNTVYFSVNGIIPVLISLDVNDDLVNSISVSISTENNPNETSRSWFAYSPESLITRYGTPSKVEIIGSYVMDKIVFSESSKWYSMNIYFSEQDLIVYYEDGEFDSKASPYIACPLINKFRYVKLWFGENPKHPPPATYSLELVSNLSMSEFANLMVANKDSNCFELSEKIFN